ncbi:unnamed protein product [Choristocarpus tenellus]
MSTRRKQVRGKDLVSRLQERVNEGNYYEALQLYKTSFARFKAQGKLDEAEELLVSGAVAMGNENERNAATELGLLLISSYEDNGRLIDEVRTSQLQRVSEAMTPGSEMSEFLKHAIKWTGPSRSEGALYLRLTLARAYVTLGNLGEASRYYAVSGAPREHSSVLLRWSKMGYKGERDLFLCRAVLCTLSFNRTSDAAELWAASATATSDISGSPEEDGNAWLDTPLCRFTRFVIELAEAKDGAKLATPEIANTFLSIKDKYKPSLNRDPHLEQVRIFFKVDTRGSKYLGGGVGVRFSPFFRFSLFLCDFVTRVGF